MGLFERVPVPSLFQHSTRLSETACSKSPQREGDSERQRQKDRSARPPPRATCSAESPFKGRQMLPALLISHRVCLIQLTLARALALSPPCHSAMAEALTDLTAPQRVPSRTQLCRLRALTCSFTSASWPLAFLSLLPHFPTFPSIQTPVSKGFRGIQTKTLWTLWTCTPILAVNYGEAFVYVPHW